MSPASTTAASTGNAFTFKVTAAAAVSGKLSLAVPSGWTTPQGTNSRGRGYVAIQRLTCTSAARAAAISKGVILVSFTCAKGESFSVSYGGTAASSEVTAPRTAGKYTYTTKAKIGSAGFTPLAAQPVVTVQPGSAVRLNVTGLPGSVTAGTPQNVTVTAVDAYGNTATGFRGTIHFTSTDVEAVLPAKYSFTRSDQGSHAFAGGVTFVIAGSQSLTATDTTTSSVTGSQTVTVSAPKTDHVYWADKYVTAKTLGTIEAIPPGGGTAAILATGQAPTGGMAVDGTSVYWGTATGTIEKVPLAGGTPTVLASGLGFPVAVAVEGSSVYWADQVDGTIEKVPVDGGTPTVLFSSANAEGYLPDPTAIVVNSSGVYWADEANGFIDSAPLAGVSFGGIPTTLASGQDDPVAVAVNSSGVYWADKGSGTIDMVPPGGAAAPTVLASGQDDPVAIAVEGSNLYWADETGGTIEKMPLAGGTPTVLASGQDDPVAIAVDGTSVYWADQGSGTVDKMPLDGATAPTVLATGQSSPMGIALSP